MVFTRLVIFVFAAIGMLNVESFNNHSALSTFSDSKVDKAKILSDSDVFYLYIYEKYDSLVNSKVVLDDDLKIGLYSASLSHLRRFEEATKIIPLFNQLEFLDDTEIIGHEEIVKHYPNYRYPNEMGSYQRYAVHEFLFINSDGYLMTGFYLQ